MRIMKNIIPEGQEFKERFIEDNDIMRGGLVFFLNEYLDDYEDELGSFRWAYEIYL